MSRRTLQALERLFEGAADASRARDTIARRFEVGRMIVAQHDGSSLRELSRALGGRASRTFLHRCTTAYRLGKSFPFILESPRLRVSHLDAVECLARPVQGRLLLEAEHGHWSVRQLRDRAMAEREHTAGSSVDAAGARRALKQLRASLSALASYCSFSKDSTSSTVDEIRTDLVQVRDLSASLLGQSEFASR